jgi:flagellar biosynthesis/type III secretory pathway protein FliH
MPSSNRIIKNTPILEEDTGWIIDTVFDEYEEEVVEENSESAEQLAEAKKKKARILLNAEEEASQILEQAKIEAEELKKVAQEQGYTEGKQQGYEDGFQNGYLKGQQESDILKQQARVMISEAQEEIENYVQDKKESLLSLSVHMAEKIIHEQLELMPEGIMELVHPILHQLDREEDFVSLTVHPSVRQVLRDKIPELQQSYPGVRFAILADETLEKGGIIIESAHKVVDLQVRKQLEAMLTELKEMERDI